MTVIFDRTKVGFLQFMSGRRIDSDVSLGDLFTRVPSRKNVGGVADPRIDLIEICHRYDGRLQTVDRLGMARLPAFAVRQPPPC